MSTTLTAKQINKKSPAISSITKLAAGSLFVLASYNSEKISNDQPLAFYNHGKLNQFRLSDAQTAILPQRDFTFVSQRIDGFSNPENLPHFLEPEDYPNTTAINLALEILSIFQSHNILPSAVNPSPEGGVMFEHIVSEHYFMFEIYNQWGIAYLHRTPDGQIHDEEITKDQVINTIKQDIAPLQ